jgi:hypothetical protein
MAIGIKNQFLFPERLFSVMVALTVPIKKMAACR